MEQRNDVMVHAMGRAPQNTDNDYLQYKIGDFWIDQSDSNRTYLCRHLGDWVEVQMATDYGFQTADKTIAGAVNETLLEISSIKELISSQASAQNQLADKNFVNSTVQNMAADRVYADNNKGNFPTRVAITSATTFYDVHGNTVTPTHNDYAIVMADEGAPAPYTNQQARWKFITNTWAYDYSYNTQFTSNQQNGLDWLAANNVNDIQLKTEKNKPNGYAGLNSTGVVDNQQLPHKSSVYVIPPLSATSPSNSFNIFTLNTQSTGNYNISPDNLKLPYIAIGDSATDLNTITKPGIYEIAGNCINSPFSNYSDIIYLLVLSAYGNNATQIALKKERNNTDAKEIYRRDNYDISNWNSWKPLFPTITAGNNVTVQYDEPTNSYTISAASGGGNNPINSETAGLELFPFLMCTNSDQMMESMNGVGRAFAMMFTPVLSKSISKLQYIVAQGAPSSFEFALYRYTGAFSNGSIPVVYLGKTNTVSNNNTGIVEATFETAVALLAGEVYYLVIRTAIGDQIPRLRSANLNLLQDNFAPAVLKGQNVNNITTLTSLSGLEKLSGNRIVPYVKMY